MYKLTKEGEEYLKNGLPEKNLLLILQEGEKSLEEVSKVPRSSIAVGWARRDGWIEIVDGIVKLTDSGRKAVSGKIFIEDALEDVEKTGKTDTDMIKILLSRKLIEEVKETRRERKGIFERLFPKKKEEALKKGSKEIAQLTPELIKSGKWKGTPFRSYDVKTPAPNIYPGKKQPYIQFMENVKEKLIEMGFKEMKGPLVETFFWNTDALFMPQDHPARSIHDVLVLKNPKSGKLPDENIVAKVRATHEGGWVTGSSGWGGEWSREEASKLLMRSQTTAISARTLLEHGDKPGKYFSIDRNYRYDVIDAKHSIEFYQCEGIVIGENLTFRNLLGYIKELSTAMGSPEVKFKPGYFPFTEPSVEGYIKHPHLGWVEVHCAGMMRPEVLRPLGLEKCQVLAWGLGIPRLAMVKLGIDDIRMLFSDDLDWMRKAPMVR